MLKGIDPLLNADLLYVLCAMGHGDDLIIVDMNFPAQSFARHTVYGSILRIDRSATQVIASVLSVYPLDTFVDDSTARMEVVGAPHDIPQVQLEVQTVIDSVSGPNVPMIGIERFAFYERVKQAYAIIQTSEMRLYGCFCLRKGVIHPDDIVV